MDLKMTTRETEGAVLLELRGRLVCGPGCDALHRMVHELLAANKNNIVLVLDEITYCDSSGLGCLVAVFTTIQKWKGKLRLVSPSQRLQEVLDLTRLSSVFEIYASTAEALASFG